MYAARPHHSVKPSVTHTYTCTRAGWQSTEEGGSQTAALDSLRVPLSTATSKSTSVCGWAAVFNKPKSYWGERLISSWQNVLWRNADWLYERIRGAEKKSSESDKTGETSVIKRFIKVAGSEETRTERWEGLIYSERGGMKELGGENAEEEK